MVTTLNKLKESILRNYDVFIASASYENRSVSIINAIGDEIQFNYKLVSLSIPHKNLIKGNLDIFKNHGFKIVEIDNTNQIVTVSNFYNELNSIFLVNPNASFLIDITTFTRQTLLILLRLMRNTLSTKSTVKLLYNPAKEYSIGLEYKDKWLTQGVLEVNSVFGYSGIIRPSRPYHLIILMGFEVERASSLITAYEPAEITIGYASKDDSTYPEHYELNKQKFDELLIEFPFAKSFEFPAINLSACKAEILNQAKKHAGHNVIIASMNNKISTIACALAAFENNEIQLAIAIPAIYNYENYSIPGDSCYIIDMPEFIKEQ